MTMRESRPSGVDTTQKAKKNKPDSKKKPSILGMYTLAGTTTKKRRAFGGTQAKKHALTGKKEPRWGLHALPGKKIPAGPQPP